MRIYFGLAEALVSDSRKINYSNADMPSSNIQLDITCFLPFGAADNRLLERTFAVALELTMLHGMVISEFDCGHARARAKLRRNRPITSAHPFPKQLIVTRLPFCFLQSSTNIRLQDVFLSLGIPLHLPSLFSPARYAHVGNPVNF